MKSWGDVLAELEAHIDAAVSALDGRDDRPVWEPPVETAGPIPEELLPKAELLLARMLELEVQYADRLKELRLAMRATPVSDPTREPARLLDRRAQ